MRKAWRIYWWVFSVAILFGAIAVWSSIESLNSVVHHVYIQDPSFGDVYKGISIAQISDLHIKRDDKQVVQILKIMRELKVDAIVLTGDYVEWNGDYESALNVLAQFTADKGVFAVMGDYDYSNSRKSCLFCHEQGTGKATKRHSIKFLRNSCDEVAAGKDSTLICGIDGRQADEPLPPEVVKRVQSAAKGRAAIVLSHSPLVFDMIDSGQDILVLAGDTHGGQIPLPSWVWKLLGYNKNARYEQGWFEEGKRKMYVNRGIGTSHFPIRFMRPPEITVFHFQVTENEVHRVHRVS
jgi:hypothetical protein